MKKEPVTMLPMKDSSVNCGCIQLRGLVVQQQSENAAFFLTNFRDGILAPLAQKVQVFFSYRSDTTWEKFDQVNYATFSI
jgi:hypothetical protein